MIIDLINQTPGDFERPNKNYKGKKYRSVIFLNPYCVAQFYEIENRLITNWTRKQIITSKQGQTYTSMNASMQTNSFIVVYHDSKKISYKEVIKKLNSTINKQLHQKELSVTSQGVKHTLQRKHNE
tara:strand:+ start:170 stop:547 length:378 start_codon:yes stop_codon:yes gene_type:complete